MTPAPLGKQLLVAYICLAAFVGTIQIGGSVITQLDHWSYHLTNGAFGKLNDR